MIGNDVVDLLDPESRPETFRPRFDERVFSEDERRAIAADHNPFARRWAHWAAKEATYKLARQINSTFVFSPRRLIPDYSSVETGVGPRLERRGRLVLEGCGAGSGLHGLPISVRSFETSERIHVVAVTESTDWGVVDYAVEAPVEAAMEAAVDVGAPPDRVDGPRRVDSSMAVRAMAVGEIGRRLGVSMNRLLIGRRGRIPVVMLDGVETSLSLSLSHHGKWIGYAMVLRNLAVAGYSCDSTQKLCFLPGQRRASTPGLPARVLRQAPGRGPTA